MNVDHSVALAEFELVDRIMGWVERDCFYCYFWLRCLSAVARRPFSPKGLHGRLMSDISDCVVRTDPLQSKTPMVAKCRHFEIVCVPWVSLD